MPRKFILDAQLKEIEISTEAKSIEKAFIYFIDNILLLSARNNAAAIRIIVERTTGEIVCSFLIDKIDLCTMPAGSLLNEASELNDPRLGLGMLYFKKFFAANEWGLTETMNESSMKIDLIFNDKDGERNDR